MGALIVFALNRITLGAATVLLFLLTIALLMSVVVRYFSLGSFYGIDELSRFGAIWLVFLGVPAALQYRQHLALDTFVQWVSPRGRLWLGILVKLLAAVFLANFAWQGMILMAQTHEIKSPGLGLPMSFAYAAAPVGSGLMLLTLLHQFADNIKDIVQGTLPQEDEASTPNLDNQAGGVV